MKESRWEGGKQCDQMVNLFFNIWPFATVKISPTRSQIYQSRLSILTNKKWTVKTLPKTCTLLPKWQIFAKSGPTGGKVVERERGKHHFILIFSPVPSSLASIDHLSARIKPATPPVNQKSNNLFKTWTTIGQLINNR